VDVRTAAFAAERFSQGGPVTTIAPTQVRAGTVIRMLAVAGSVAALQLWAGCSEDDPGLRMPSMIAGGGAAVGGDDGAGSGRSGGAGSLASAGTRAAGSAGAGAPGVAGTSAGATAMSGRGSLAGRGASAGMASAGMGGAAAPDPSGVAPDQIMLGGIAANRSNGLDWSRVKGATGYRLFFANSAGVSPSTGQAIDVPDPAYVHRALTNGMTYHYVVCAVLSGMLGPPSNEVSLQPAGEWALEHLGTGDFDNVIDGQRVPRVPIDKRIQVLLFAEGYTEPDLAVFHADATHGATMPGNDVDRWVDEVFAKDPYKRLRDAFVIWYLPRASAARSGAGDTAFDVVVSNGGVTQIDAAAAPVWSAIDGEGPDKFAFPPGTAQPTQLVAAFMVFDAERGRGGMSGITSSLRNPAGNQNLRAAFGLGYPHEFTHAFASLGDEYMEVSGRLPRVAETSNLSPSNRCDELPWSHLLEGRGINTTVGLVGAFGTPELGYHSELRCQMNGTHENGQIFCASGDERYSNLLLRSDHLCNFCREMTTYRVFERTGILTGSGSFATWKAMYRPKFFERFGFFVPPGAIPQAVECNRGQAGKAVYHACVP
jgi:hypothetical protein